MGSASPARFRIICTCFSATLHASGGPTNATRQSVFSCEIQTCDAETDDRPTKTTLKLWRVVGNSNTRRVRECVYEIRRKRRETGTLARRFSQITGIAIAARENCLSKIVCTVRPERLFRNYTGIKIQSRPSVRFSTAVSRDVVQTQREN